MNIEQILKRTLRSRLEPLNPPAFQETLLGRTRTRRLMLLALTSGVFVIAIAAGTLVLQTITSSPGKDDGSPVATEPTPIPSPPATTADPVACVGGPWATYCPEAQWARGVAERAGYSVVGDTGSALIINDGTYSFNFWAFEPEDPSTRQEALRSENYDLLTEIDGTRVYFDGIRLTWEMHGLYAWLNSGPGRGPTTTEREVIAEIVRASIDSPYPSGPGLAVSDETVRAGEAIDFHVQATQNYTWGVATALETFNDGEWVVLYYWSTGGDKHSRIIEAFTAEEQNVFPAIGFTGDASFRIRIPDVEPGEYRITKTFITGGLGPVEDRTTTPAIQITVAP